MPTSLLDSQFRTLEPPAPDERGITVDIDAEATQLASEIAARLNSPGSGPERRQ